MLCIVPYFRSFCDTYVSDCRTVNQQIPKYLSPLYDSLSRVEAWKLICTEGHQSWLYCTAGEDARSATAGPPQTVPPLSPERINLLTFISSTQSNLISEIKAQTQHDKLLLATPNPNCSGTAPRNEQEMVYALPYVLTSYQNEGSSHSLLCLIFHVVCKHRLVMEIVFQ